MAAGIATMVGLVLTAAEVLLIGSAVWLTVGITLAVLMGRQGPQLIRMVPHRDDPRTDRLAAGLGPDQV